jgi:hypothetical protein
MDWRRPLGEVGIITDIHTAHNPHTVRDNTDTTCGVSPLPDSAPHCYTENNNWLLPLVGTPWQRGWLTGGAPATALPLSPPAPTEPAQQPAVALLAHLDN